MIKTSAKTTSILAVGIAAIMVLCAVSGAIIYNNSTNNNNTTDSGDIPVSPIRPIDDPTKVTTLPSNSSDLMTMLSKSGEDGNALLVDRLTNNNYTFNGTTYSIKTNSDVAKYLYSLGYTVAGNHLAADIAGLDAQEATVATVDALTLSDEELEKIKAAAENNTDNSYGMSADKEDTMDVDDSLAAAKKKKSRTFSESISESSSFSSLKDLTVRQFASGSWMTDIENRPMAYYLYFMEFTDKESMVLDAMIGTPFSLDGKLIRTVADADDLAQMFYASGYEVVGTSLVDNSLSLLVNGSALATVSNFKLANVDDSALLYKAPMLRAAAVGAVASISGPFYDLNDMTVELFISNNYMMNEVRKAQMSSDLEISNVLTNNSSQKACVVAQYIRERSTEIVDSDSESSIESIVALDLIVGTPFMTKDNRIAVITDLSTLADFFESAGVVVKDNRAVYCTYNENANGVMMTASLNGMKAQLAYEILAQKNCTSRCISLEDIENAIAEKIAEKEKKAAEAKAADSQTTVVVEEQTDDSEEDSDVEEIYFESSMESFRAALGEMDESSQLISALDGCTFNDLDGNDVTLDSSKDGSIITMMRQLGFEFNDDGILVVDGTTYAIDELEVGKMIQIIDAFYLKTDIDENVEIPDANEVPKEEPKEEPKVEKSATFEFDDLYGLVNAFKDIEDGSITVNEAMQGSSFKGMTINNDGDVISCLSNFFGNDAAKEYTYIQVGDFVNLEAVHNYLNANLEGVAEEE